MSPEPPEVAPPPAPAAPDATRLRRWGQHVRTLGETARLLGPSAHLIATTEAHTYAYSVSANFLLASLPFLFLLLWVANHLLPWLPNQAVITQLVHDSFPAGQDLITNNMVRLASRPTVEVFSLIMLAISSSGVFLPLEVALNSIWGFKRNRGYLANQALSLGLVLACGAVAYLSVMLAGLGRMAVTAVFPAGWTGTIGGLSALFLNASALPAAMVVFLLIYWWLPNGPVPVAQVIPAAFYTGILAEIFKIAFHFCLPWFGFDDVYGTRLAVAVTLVVWGYGGALLLLFGASLSARGVARMPAVHLKRRSHHADAAGIAEK